MTHLKIVFDPDDYPETTPVEESFDDVKQAVHWLLDHLAWWSFDEDVTVYVDGEPFVW